MKEGEWEAKLILSQIGYSFDASHYDDGSENSKPDLRQSNGRYIEVTQTRHNKGRFREISNFAKLPLDVQLERHLQAHAAWERVVNSDYEAKEGELTDKGREQLNADRKLLIEYSGIDIFTGCRVEDAESKDSPSIIYSVDNIIDRIVHKSKKHPRGDTDLFLFIAPEEMKELENAMCDRLLCRTFENISLFQNRIFPNHGQMRNYIENMIFPLTR